jgi:fatty acid desaturase
VFKTRRLNDVFGQLLGFIVLSPFKADRWFHFAHHRHTQDPLKDPELMGRASSRLIDYVANFVGIEHWYRRVRGILTTASGRLRPHVYWLSAQQRGEVIREARRYVVAYAALAAASLAFESWILVQLWIAPMFCTKWFHQLQNTGEHGGMPRIPDMLENTRTLRGPAVMRWLMWNMSFHTAHHMFPGVPFFRLPELHRAIEIKLERSIPSAGYVEAQISIVRSYMRQANGQA